MSARFPNYLKLGVLAEGGGIILLILSLASRPPVHLFLLGTGASLLLMGLLCFLFFLKQVLSGKMLNRNECWGNAPKRGEIPRERRLSGG